MNFHQILLVYILAKDLLSKEFGDEETPDYLKITVYKYIIMLKSVILKDEKILQVIQEKELCKYNNEELEWETMLNPRNGKAKTFFKQVQDIENMDIL